MKIIKKSVLISMLAVLAVPVVNAADTTLNITGRVTASACAVDGNTSVNVDLGNNIQASGLAAATNTSTAVPVQLKLKDCPAATTSAIVTFGGTEDTAAPGRYISGGTASNVAVELIETSSGDLKGPGSSITLPIQADRTVTYVLESRAYAKAMVSPGTISATVQATFTYQ